MSTATWLSSSFALSRAIPPDLSASLRLVVDGLDYPASLVAEDERRTQVLEKE